MNKEIFKKYLIGDNNPYLLNDNNNGKTIMISGSWGAGKTYFWRNEIETTLKSKLKDKVYLYVSLYGKDNLDLLKKEILINASSLDNILSKEVSSFGFDILSSLKDSDMKIAQILKAFSKATESAKEYKGIQKLQDGGIICFDDFERKSEKINLNDLFGFISQLAIELKCKIIIILNSDVFKGKEAEIFSNVKEKTINKFFYFNPTIRELFISIYSDTKYNELDNYKNYILVVIEETQELNARIYIQVLDNCLEWIKINNDINNNIIRVLVLGTFNFILNHTIFDYTIPINSNKMTGAIEYRYKEINYLNKDINKYFELITRDRTNDNISNYAYPSIHLTETQFIRFLTEKNINTQDIKQMKKSIISLWKYGYRLNYTSMVTEDIYNKIANFIETGILTSSN